MTRTQPVCSTNDVPEGEARMFVLDEQLTVAVFHLSGQFFALQNACPHAGASLAHGILDGDTVRCRIHHWRFRIRDGRYLDEEKPSCNARSFPVRIVNHQVNIELD